MDAGERRARCPFVAGSHATESDVGNSPLPPRPRPVHQATRGACIRCDATNSQSERGGAELSTMSTPSLHRLRLTPRSPMLAKVDRRHLRDLGPACFRSLPSLALPAVEPTPNARACLPRQRHLRCGEPCRVHRTSNRGALGEDPACRRNREGVGSICRWHLTKPWPPLGG